MNLRLIVLAMLFLSGCTQEFIVLKSPTTGQIVECRAHSENSLTPGIQTMIDNSAARSCAKGYEAAGYQRMN